MQIERADPWRRFGEIWFSIMERCCEPPICEATICRVPAQYCPMFQRHRWEAAIAERDTGGSDAFPQEKE